MNLIVLMVYLLGALSLSSAIFNDDDDVTKLRSRKTADCPAVARYRSPVDLVHPKACETATDLKGLNLVHPLRYKVSVASQNHLTLIPYVKDGGANLPYISGGPLKDANATYRLGLITFSKESRHWFAGKSFPMEAELYFYRTSLGSFRKALDSPTGVVGLGLLFKEDAPPYGEEIFLHGEQDDGPEEMRFYSAALLPERVDTYYFYNGSFIDSDCHEPVLWIIDKRVRAISRSHMSSLASRMNLADGQDSYFYRERSLVQPLGTRTVYSSKQLKVLPSRYYNQKKKPDNIDHFFLFIMSIIIFFMQCGFAFMEAGAVKSKNTVNILIKNWLDVCIGALVYWCTGYALMYGSEGNSFLSWSYFFGIGLQDYKLSKWFFNFVFAATAATLVSGSLAERCNFVAYIVYSVMITGFIYPIIAHWAWHPMGWLRMNGFHDFAGSGVVHLCGGICALVGCILMGPRKGRFDKYGNLVTMPGHSIPLSALGGFILIFGFFACNGAKQGSISHPEDGILVILAIVNTALGTSAAGVFTLIFNKTGIVPGTGGNYSFLDTMNGSLTGTIALCAGCDVYDQWAAIVVGAFSGPLFLFSKYILLKYKIDDPLDAIPVHGAGGILGVLAVYIFSPKGVLLTWSEDAFNGLLWNVIGLVAIVAWTFVTCFVMFFTLKHLDLLRVDPEMEFKGMDLIKHGEAAYPAEAWVEIQYGGPSKSNSEANLKSLTKNLSSGNDLASSFSNRRHSNGGLGFKGSSSGLAGFLSRKQSGAEDGGISNEGFVPDEGSNANGATGGGILKKPKLKKKSSGLPPHMKSEGDALYNNPQELFPTYNSLFNAMRNVAARAQLDMEASAYRKAKTEASKKTRRESETSLKEGFKQLRRASVSIVAGAESVCKMEENEEDNVKNAVGEEVVKVGIEMAKPLDEDDQEGK